MNIVLIFTILAVFFFCLPFWIYCNLSATSLKEKESEVFKKKADFLDRFLSKAFVCLEEQKDSVCKSLSIDRKEYDKLLNPEDDCTMLKECFDDVLKPYGYTCHVGDEPKCRCCGVSVHTVRLTICDTCYKDYDHR